MKLDLNSPKDISDDELCLCNIDILLIIILSTLLSVIHTSNTDV